MESELVQLSAILKQGTRQNHDAAESSDFQARLANANLPLDAYKAYLEQLYLIHSRLEQGLVTSEDLRQVAKSEQHQTDFLKRDLESLGVNVGTIKPLSSTATILTHIEEKTRNQPLSLLGYHYVLFGSKHGGKFIAAQIRKKFGFESAGCLYFDPYGTNFQGYWQDFRESMDKLANQKDFADSALDSAKEMFSYFDRLGNELSSEYLRN